MKKTTLFFLIAVLASTLSLQACTTAIVSGQFTPDGRPLLFKHRDTSRLDNRLAYFTDGQYDYIGLVNSQDVEGNNVWAGTNSAGFSIMNSANYNMNLNDTVSVMDQEGAVMKRALQTCATLDDFEKMLNESPHPWRVNANFGVIDAEGGAAYYETGNFSFTKFDVNDPALAPFGYIIRTNFGFTGGRKEEYGVIRFQTATDLFYTAANMQDLSLKFILQDVSRSLKHSLTRTDLWDQMPRRSVEPRFVCLEDFIPRHSSAATVVVQGVKAGEDPAFTTFWTVLGFPLCSVAAPVWMAGGEKLPALLSAGPSGNAPLCDWALTLKKRVFPLTKGSHKKYINLSALINGEGQGILQKLKPMEENILQKSGLTLENWRQKGMKREEIQKFYEWLDDFIGESYNKAFGFLPE